MSNHLNRKAEAALEKVFGRSLAADWAKTAVLPASGEMVVYFRLPGENHEALMLLRKNAVAGPAPLPPPFPAAGDRVAPVEMDDEKEKGSSLNIAASGRILSAFVMDPARSAPALRWNVDFRAWSDPEGLSLYVRKLEKDMPCPSDSRAWSKTLRTVRKIPEGLNTYRYGRSKSLTLVLDRPPAFLKARIFPGGMFESCLRVDEKRKEAAGRILLSRSAASTASRDFHLLAGENFFQVERAAFVPPDISSEKLKGIERRLLRDASEDRELLATLFKSETRWEDFVI